MAHPRLHAQQTPNKLAVEMTDGSGSLTYVELEQRANQGAHLIRGLRIVRGDTIAFWLPNGTGVFEVYWAAQRSGLYVTPIATALTAEEAGFILENSGSRLLIADDAIAAFADLVAPPGLTVMRLNEWRARCASLPSTPIADETPGFHMVYSSGTTGRPKGIRLPLPTGDVTAPHTLAERAANVYRVGHDSNYLSPAPLYHTAPLAFTTSCHRLGATVYVMPRFDPEAALAAIATYRIDVTQMVPTMFVRLLKMPDAVRRSYDVSSLRRVIHAAAPCPVDIKRAMIEWLGPIILEYYGGSEGNGSTFITSEEWLQKPGSVGRANWGTIHICDDGGAELGPGEPGLVYFEGGWDFQYLGDPEKSRDARHPVHTNWSALGDVGYLDADGYLFLTDRKSFMIISGGVNVYPQEVENLLISHPRVADAAVIGVPDAEMGEAVKAVVQTLDPADATPAFAADLIAHCRAHLSAIKCPRSIDFDQALPRLDNGKLYKRVIRDRYWAGHDRRIA
jgi:acyl-CoA synthetase (AMP-forming)/AMP-acid ligase II